MFYNIATMQFFSANAARIVHKLFSCRKVTCASECVASLFVWAWVNKRERENTRWRLANEDEFVCWASITLNQSMNPAAECIGIGADDSFFRVFGDLGRVLDLKLKQIFDMCVVRN